MESYGVAAARGAAAGAAGSVVQTGIGLALDRLLLPPKQHNNIAPRLVKRLAQWTGRGKNRPRDWTIGTLFHLGYGVGWGAFLGVARRRTQLPPLPLGTFTGGLIYLLAFSKRGVGTVTATEPPPHNRNWRKEASLVSVAWGYALVTAFLDQWLARTGLSRTARLAGR
jgi:hypothetical protein